MILGIPQEIWNYEWMGSTVGQYVVASGLFALLLVVLGMTKSFLLRWASRKVAQTENQADDAIVKVFKTIKPPFYVLVALWGAVQWLTLNESAQNVVDIVLVILLTWQVVYALQVFLQYLIEDKFIDKDDKSGELVAGIVSGVSRIVLWSLGFLFVLSNIGIDITSLITGLGIGGIAVALAVQNVLGDLFSSLAIYFDRPFSPGDYISTKNVSGTVQKVGIKTTRLKALSGEEVVVPNKELTDSQIHNYKRMERRRVAFEVGVVYGTSQKQMLAIPSMIQEIIEHIQDVTFGRAHFHEFAGSSLNFEIVYHVEGREYELFMDRQQEILLAIKEKFEAEGIDMAFPTQTVVIDNASLDVKGKQA